MISKKVLSVDLWVEMHHDQNYPQDTLYVIKDNLNDSEVVLTPREIDKLIKVLQVIKCEMESKNQK